MDITVSGDYAYVADINVDGNKNGAGRGLHIIDISDPASPEFKGSYFDGNVGAVEVRGNTARVRLHAAARRA